MEGGKTLSEQLPSEKSDLEKWVSLRIHRNLATATKPCDDCCCALEIRESPRFSTLKMMSVRNAEFPASSMASLLLDVFCFVCCIYFYIIIDLEQRPYQFSNKKHTECCRIVLWNIFAEHNSEMMHPSRANMHLVTRDCVAAALSAGGKGPGPYDAPWLPKGKGKGFEKGLDTSGYGPLIFSCRLIEWVQDERNRGVLGPTRSRQTYCDCDLLLVRNTKDQNDCFQEARLTRTNGESTRYYPTSCSAMGSYEMLFCTLEKGSSTPCISWFPHI